jgi:hypothetical protein
MMKLLCSLCFVFFAISTVGAASPENEQKASEKFDQAVLLKSVWPGMTIKQSLQILGDPDESMQVWDSEGAKAIRYGVFWLIPQVDGIQIECIINQRGFSTTYEMANPCRAVDEGYVLISQ